MTVESCASEARQPFGSGGLVVVLLFFNTLTAFSLDMYGPALPGMAEYFGVPVAVSNLSLTGYLLFNAVGMLVFGTVSDKYGRKPLLLAGAVVYTLSSACCALAPTVVVLIVGRCFQALGSACSASVAVAVVKDCFSGKTRENVLVAVQASHTIAPLVAPAAGAFVLTAFSWRATFWTLFAVGVVGVVFALSFRETAPRATLQRNLSLRAQMGRIGYVMRNPGFVLGLIVLSFFMASFTIYVSMASYIYIGFFGLTAQQFSFFFAAAALVASSGLVLYPLFLSRVSKKRLVSILLAAAACSLLAEGALGATSAWAFFLLLLPHYFGIIVIKPCFVNLLLSQEDDDTGVLASLTMFSPNLVGCLATQCMSAMGTQYVASYVAVSSVCLAVGIVAWVVIASGKAKMMGLS